MIEIKIWGPTAEIESKGNGADLIPEIIIGINMLCTQVVTSDKGREIVHKLVTKEFESGDMFANQADSIEEI